MNAEQSHSDVEEGCSRFAPEIIYIRVDVRGVPFVWKVKGEDDCRRAVYDDWIVRTGSFVV